MNFDFSVESRPLITLWRPWLLITLLSLVFFMLMALITFFIMGYPMNSLFHFLFVRWVFIWIYTPFFALAIAFQSQQKIIRVTHQESLNTDEVISMLNKLNWVVCSKTPERVVFTCSNRFERLFHAGQQVTLMEFDEGKTIFTVPSRLVYHIHHGFKFGNFLIETN